jgi:hypothetical protein
MPEHAIKWQCRGVLKCKACLNQRLPTLHLAFFQRVRKSYTKLFSLSGYGNVIDWHPFVHSEERNHFHDVLVKRKQVSLICGTPNCGGMAADKTFKFSLEWKIDFSKKALRLQRGTVRSCLSTCFSTFFYCPLP